jgi:hypothetical protein
MSGGYLQLIAYGAQDMYLTNDPQITFFKIIYRRHTNFSVETYEHALLDNPNFGDRSEIILPRSGDLMTKMYLRVVVSSVVPLPDERFAWVRNLGFAIIQQIQVNIGGAMIDRQYGTWLDIWYSLVNREKSDQSGIRKMIGDVEMMTGYNNRPKPQYTLFIPLKFWFNRHYGLALPMIAIQYHQVEIKLQFTDVKSLIVTNSRFSQFNCLNIQEASFLVDYVYLEGTERKNFASGGHEYLIEQVQFNNPESIASDNQKIRLTFNYPTKELIWLMRNGKYITGKEFLCYTDNDDWRCEILRCSRQIIHESVLLAHNPPEFGIWQEFEPGAFGKTANGKITVNNRSDESLWVNTDSLTIDGYSLTNKISASITVVDNKIIVTDVVTAITVRDVSVPVCRMSDTRIYRDNVKVVQFNNYGLWIDGSVNPIAFSMLEYNDQRRFERRDGDFFNYLQPEMHHSNTPADGINVYSFALYPEDHQPSGTTNFSKVEYIFLTLWFCDVCYTPGLPRLDAFDCDSLIYVFGFNYNVLRVSNGLAGLCYTD